ncbi:hypothetical protein CSUB01_11634 [Colletotrichum sublineola]|uniref:Uncharacterized protein n=1 Tax=Colletotrichum sublineola TaxID=1173701 RepID=A0A066XLP7_COLSU|nr:hypothetical protein CSUB01_11634 [Colletotrichum sublineola]
MLFGLAGSDKDMIALVRSSGQWPARAGDTLTTDFTTELGRSGTAERGNHTIHVSFESRGAENTKPTAYFAISGKSGSGSNSGTKWGFNPCRSVFEAERLLVEERSLRAVEQKEAIHSRAIVHRERCVTRAAMVPGLESSAAELSQ